MKPQHRSILAIGASVLVLIVWYAFFAPQKSAPPPAAPAVEKATASGEESPGGDTSTGEGAEGTAIAQAEEKGAAAPDAQADLPQVETTIDTDQVHAVFTNKGGVPLVWQLKGYKQEAEKDSPPMDMAKVSAGETPSMALSFDGANFAFPKAPTYRVASADGTRVVYEWKSDEAVVTKAIAIDKMNYTANIDVSVKNLTGKTLNAKPVLTVSGASIPGKKSGFFSFLKPPPSGNSSPVYYLDGKVRREKSINKIPVAQVIASDPTSGGGLYWAGLETRYFLSAVIPRNLSSDVSAVIGAAPLASAGKGAWNVYAGSALTPMSVVPGGSASVQFSAYLGPKEINDLKAVGVHLDDAIDYGWFTIIAIPILYLLKMFYAVVQNYGVAIILLTIFIKLLLHPINVKSMKSMKAMQQLQPKLKELQAKYKGNKEKLNMETMQLFRSHKVNPMGGCLPMVLQFPIYIALYKVLWNSIELYHAPFFWFYKDLSAPDPYMITPLLLGVFMVAQQKLMPSATADPAQQKMMMIMPVMFTGFMVFLPVGLVVYILVNTAMTVTTQWMYNRGIRMRDVIRFRFKTTAMVT